MLGAFMFDPIAVTLAGPGAEGHIHRRKKGNIGSTLMPNV
jgi:hypothetical protein